MSRIAHEPSINAKALVSTKTRSREVTQSKNSSVLITTDERMILLQQVAKSSSAYHPQNVILRGMEELAELKNGDQIQPGTDAYKFITHYEFENSSLLIHGTSEKYRALLAKLSQDFQEEMKCKTTVEKSLAHLAAQNFVRCLNFQFLINSLVDRDSYTEINTIRLSVLNKGYDQANRQYLSTIQQLKSLKHPSISVTVKANQANVANQQLIQENYDNKTK